MRTVVVLGMHRSGTSAVTRALNLLGGDLGLGALPQRAGLVGRLEVALLGANEDGVAHEVGVARHELAQAPGLEELLVLVAQVQRDARAALGPGNGLDAEFAFAGGFPLHALFGG